MWPFLEGHETSPLPRPGAGWLTDAVKDQYRAVWGQGLTGPLNFYRASPLYPPTAQDRSVMALQFPPEAVTVRVPTRVVWAEDDTALLPALVDGLEVFVPQLVLRRVAQATHWVIHEQPARIAQEIEAALRDA
jgi:pimeloyl-ACP methyl ester carboxylesterase